MDTNQTIKMTDEYTLRMLGDNVTLMRSAWLELHAELREDSNLAARIKAMLTDTNTHASSAALPCFSARDRQMVRRAARRCNSCGLREHAPDRFCNATLEAK